MMPIGPAPVIKTSSPSTGNEQRGVDGVSEWIEDGGHVQIDVFLVAPDVGHRHGDVVGERAGPIHAHALGVRAEMAAASETIAAAAAHHVSFAADDVAGVKVVDVRSGGDDFADEFVADHQRNRDRALRPGVPVVDVQVSSTNTYTSYANQHVVDTDDGVRNFFEPQSRLSFAFY